jgi:hypothetical protein
MTPFSGRSAQMSVSSMTRLPGERPIGPAASEGLRCARPFPEWSSAGKGQIRELASRAEIEPLGRVASEECCSPWQYADAAAINTLASVRMSREMSRAAGREVVAGSETGVPVRAEVPRPQPLPNSGTSSGGGERGCRPYRVTDGSGRPRASQAGRRGIDPCPQPWPGTGRCLHLGGVRWPKVEAPRRYQCWRSQLTDSRLHPAARRVIEVCGAAFGRPALARDRWWFRRRAR